MGVLQPWVPSIFVVLIFSCFLAWKRIRRARWERWLKHATELALADVDTPVPLNSLMHTVLVHEFGPRGARRWYKQWEKEVDPLLTSDPRFRVEPLDLQGESTPHLRVLSPGLISRSASRRP